MIPALTAISNSWLQKGKSCFLFILDCVGMTLFRNPPDVSSTDRSLLSLPTIFTSLVSEINMLASLFTILALAIYAIASPASSLASRFSKAPLPKVISSCVKTKTAAAAALTFVSSLFENTASSESHRGRRSLHILVSVALLLWRLLLTLL